MGLPIQSFVLWIWRRILTGFLKVFSLGCCMSIGCWGHQMHSPGLSLVTDPVCGFHGHDLKAKPRGRECLVWTPQNCISAFRRDYISHLAGEHLEISGDELA